MPEPAFQGQVVRKLPGIFVPLLLLCLFVVAAGMVQGIRYVVDMLISFIRGTVGRIPVIGGVFSAKANKLRRVVDTYMGRAAAACERRVSAYFRDLSTVFVELASELVAEAVMVAALLWWLTNKVGVHKLAPRIDRLERLPHKLPSTVKRLVIRQTKVIYRTVRKVERIVIKQGQVIIRTGVRALPRWVLALRARVRKLERGLVTLRKRVTRLEHKLTPAAIGALFLASLPRLGLNWLRCKQVKRAGRGVCSMNGDVLDDLLAGTLLIVGTVSIVEFAELLGAGAGFATGAVREFVRESAADDRGDTALPRGFG